MRRKTKCQDISFQFNHETVTANNQLKIEANIDYQRKKKGGGDDKDKEVKERKTK